MATEVTKKTISNQQGLQIEANRRGKAGNQGKEKGLRYAEKTYWYQCLEICQCS
jgi:hypothetical protein